MIPKKGMFQVSAVQFKMISLCLVVLGTAFILMSSTALAEVTNITVSPENPSPGDTVTVKGKASPYEEVSVSVGFEKMQSVSNGIYEYHIGKVTIPEGSESFSLRAEGVDSLDVTVYLFGIPITVPDEYVQVKNSIASFGTGKIKSGTYDIKLSGKSSDDEVSFQFGGKGSIRADSDGNFQYTYTTKNMPEGDFSLTVGEQPLQVKLGETDESDNGNDSSDSDDSGSDSDDSSSSSSSGSSSGKSISSSNTGTELRIVDADTLGGEDEDKDESSGVGDDTESMASTRDDSSESSEDESDSGEVDGYIMENKSSSDTQNSLPELGLMGAVVGVVCLGAIFIGFRKNRYK